MALISVISAVLVISLVASMEFPLINNTQRMVQSDCDTIYVLYENEDLNYIRKSSRIHPSENEYPKDW